VTIGIVITRPIIVITAVIIASAMSFGIFITIVTIIVIVASWVIRFRSMAHASLIRIYKYISIVVVVIVIIIEILSVKVVVIFVLGIFVKI
jgi:hypothetical protein